MTSIELSNDLTKAEATKLTAEIKAWAGTLWQKIREAHEGKAWKAMGYRSWSDYLAGEFDISRSRGYQLVSHANAVAELAEAAGGELSTMVDIPERVTRDMDVNAVADDVRTRVAALPDGAPEEHRHAAVSEAVESHRATSAIEPPAAKRRRAPLPDVASKAGGDFRKAVERLERIAKDDRFPAHRDQMAPALRSQLTWAAGVEADLLASLDGSEATSERPPIPTTYGPRRKHTAMLDALIVTLDGATSAFDGIRTADDIDKSVTDDEASRLAIELAAPLEHLQRVVDAIHDRAGWVR